MSHRTLLLALLLPLCALRLLMIGSMELTPDEAYYTMWSQHLDVSYYSKGPGIAATIWAGTHLFGVNEFGVRFFSPLLALGTSLLMFALARRLYGESVAFWTVLMLQVIPIYQAGGLLMTIDPLSMFFWMAALYTFWRALEESPASHHEPGSTIGRWWPATGALIGCGFLCKWTNALELLSVLLVLACTRRYRPELRRAGFWVMLGVFVLFTIPPLVWNAQHDWITYSHVSARGRLGEDLGFSFGEFFSYLGAHFGVYSPLLFAAMLIALWVGAQRARLHFKPRFLVCFAGPILLLYFLLAFREAGEANWTAPATLSLSLLTVAIFHEWALESTRLRMASLVALAIGAVMSLLTVETDLPRRVLAWVGLTLPYEQDFSARLRGWKSSAEIVENFRSDFEASHGQPVFLIGNKYQTAAALAFYMKNPRPAAAGHPPVYIPESQAIENQFSFWPRYDEMTDLPQLATDTMRRPGVADAQRADMAGALDTLRTAEKSGADALILNEARRRLVQVLQRVDPSLPLDEWFVDEQGLSLFAGRTALYITDRAEERAPSSIKGGFARVEMIACLDLERRGVPLRQLRIFACYDYHGTSL